MTNVVPTLRQWLQQPLITSPLPGFEAHAQVLRLDQLDPILSGNKAYKLLGHIEQFHQSGYSALLSFGGRHSNHLHALAAFGARWHCPTVGIVLGYPEQPLTPTLLDCQQLGMSLQFVDRATYAKRYQPAWHRQLAQQFDAYVMGEGGEGEPGLRGCRLLAPYVQQYAEVWLPVGTGTTALGLASVLPLGTKLVGVNAIADRGAQQARWQTLLDNRSWRLLDQYHAGGFARITDTLRSLIQHYDDKQLPLDPVYTAKLVWAFEQEWAAGRVHSPVLLLHTGGLQGRRGYDLPAWRGQ
ncbi:MAG: 1-aminocyclopropane-1-carboxylate deaminase [Bacterioplanes sp.]|nr:1-aminocyclopropane-1-carboxylate deaminase [Bacterioplanes sp.]